MSETKKLFESMNKYNKEIVKPSETLNEDESVIVCY